jgi:PAS domain S-box-containing protein
MNYSQLSKDELVSIIEKMLKDPKSDHPSQVKNMQAATGGADLIEIENFLSFFNTIDDLLSVIDEQGKILYVNDTLVERTGYSREELIGNSVLMLHAADRREEAAKIVGEMLAGKKDACPIPLLTKSNVQLAVETHVKMGVWNGKPAVFGVTKDISRLRLSEEKFSKVFYLNPSPCGFSELETGKYVEVNHAFCKMFGYEAAEVIGKTAYELGILDEHAKVEILARATSDGKVVNKEAVLKTKNGVPKHVLLSAENLYVHDKRYRFTVVTDITGLKEIERELRNAKESAEQSDRLKSAFLANMSHEIRTPMNGIIGFADVLRSTKVSAEEQDHFLAIIEESGARMLKIINDIIDISKIEAGHVKLHAELTNIDQQLNYLYTFFKPEAEHKGLSYCCETAVGSEEVSIITDSEKLYAILTNLIKNAIKYTERGQITVGYTLRQNEIEFFVADTGVGIPQEQLAHVFERFTRIEDARLANTEGSGLGLSIAKAYVKLLGGKIWVKSKENEGSTFYFTIPLLSVDQQKSKVSAVEAGNIPQPRNLKILIVEDDTASELLLKTYVEDLSREILICRDGLHAVDLCKSTPDIDLILMDVKLPVMSGYEAVGQIRKFNKEVKVIAETAFAVAGEYDYAMRAGCDGFLTKPLTRKRLIREIERCLNN